MAALSLKEDDIDEEARNDAARLKAEANEAFKAQEYKKAANLYSQAIDRNPFDATLYCNRAFTRIKLEEHGYAMHDATRAIEIDPKYEKAYYRRALCQLSILKPKLAISDFNKVLQLNPSNKEAKMQLEATKKLIRKIEFEKAIETEEEDPIARCREAILENACPVESDYSGPKLKSTEEGIYQITQEFVDGMLQWYKDGKSLPRRYVWEIVLGCVDVISKEPSLVDVAIQDGMTCDVIGDVHGQYYDVLHLLTLTGKPSNTHCLLFNGDFVDRGSWSIEVVVTLFAFKWLYPRRVFLNRGNHETKDMNKVYGFEGECKHKHGETTYKLFSQAFTNLPLATLITATLPPKMSVPSTILSPEGRKRYFVVHGGLFSKDDVTLDQIRQLPRVGRQPGQEGLMCEVNLVYWHSHVPLFTCSQLLWTDPQEMEGRGPSKRGVGIAFGPDVTKRWCTLNGVTGIIRSHEVRQEGYAVEHGGLCTTVFSAPHYCDQGTNKGAFIRIDAEGTQKYTQFENKPHPPIKPMAYAASGMQFMV